MTEDLELHLEAAKIAGYDQLRQSMAAYLGPQSVSASIIEEAQQRAETERANRETLLSVGDLLPHVNGYSGHSSVFRLKAGEDVQKKARLIQENVIWGLLGEDIVNYPRLSHPEEAYYIIGRKPSAAEQDMEEVLLLSAKPRTEFGRDDPYRLVVVKLDKSDMTTRDAITEGNRNTEFTKDEIERSIDEKSGGFEVGSSTSGSIRIANSKTRQKPKRRARLSVTNEADVLEFGIRYPKFKTYFIGQKVVHGISSEMAEIYRIDAHIAALALEFGVENGLRKLVGIEEIEAESSEEKFKEVPLTYEELQDQNEQLRSALFRTLSWSGMVDRDLLREEFAKRFPRTKNVPIENDGNQQKV